jgi:carbonic anhydrase/acetyltransferase-like protein (isoleucine patch superfamily)
MKKLQQLFDRIIQRVNINLREHEYDVTPFIQNLIPLNQLAALYAFYGVSPRHSLNFQLKNACLAGSYILGKCRVSNALIYKSDIRGDELKKKGERVSFGQFDIPIFEDEGFDIQDSLLIKTLVHNCSNDPETLERFFITNTIATHYANIHGSPIDGSFLGPFATVDLTTTGDCVIGPFSYIQAGEINHLNIDPGTIWINKPSAFNFRYQYPLNRLNDYISFTAGQAPQGALIDFIEDHQAEFQRFLKTVDFESAVPVPGNASLDPFAVAKADTRISENVLVSEHAYLENAHLGKGANAQENCYIINSRLAGNNVTAHGGKIIEADLAEDVFVGFNSFLRGQKGSRLTIGRESIIMPHTIIDISKPITIPAGHLVWGLINDHADLEANSMAANDFSKIDGKLKKGALRFEGSGASFVSAFQNRIHHILEANGAFFDGEDQRGHAQINRNISFNIIQAFPEGEFAGLCPTISIQP